MTNLLVRQAVAVGQHDQVRQTVVTNTEFVLRQIGGEAESAKQSLGGKRGVLALFITSADVSRGCWQANVLWRLLRNESSQGIADYLSLPESKFVTYPFWRQVTSRFVEHLINSSAVLHAVVQPSFSTAYYAYSVFLAVCQVLRDISCVNPSRTPKAFKGKGSAVNQGVNSGLLDLAGAGA
jgi:hypothetical protein